MKVKVSELSGPALDWAVARIEGVPVRRELSGDDGNGNCVVWLSHQCLPYSPSTDWTQGGPLLSKYQIGFAKRVGGWAASFDESGYSCIAVEFGDDHLTAACRSIVSAELGEFVDVPDELLTAA